MNIQEILINCMWSAFFATSMSILNSTPFKYIIPTFVCGFIGVLIRDLCQGWGLSTNWSTMIAALMIVIAAGLIIRSRDIPPVVLICGVLPLWASVAMFKLLNDMRNVSNLSGEELSKSATDLSANFAIVVVISIVIALGFAVGLALLRLIYKDTSKIEKLV